MAYSNEGIDARAEVLLDATDTLAYYVKKDGTQVTVDPATAFITILDPSGNEKVARTAAVIAALGKLSYTRTWTLGTFELWEDYVALWEWQVSSVVFTDRQYFDPVKNKLNCLIDTNDLLDIYPDLVSHLGTIGETDASKPIRAAWSMLMDRIRSGKNRPSLILDKVRLVNPARQLAAHFACESLSKEPDDLWDKRAVKHLKFYEMLYGGLGELKYDRDEDGLAAQSETKPINRRTFGV